MYQEERVVRAVRLPASTDAELRALASSRRCTINELVAQAVQDLVAEAPTVAPEPSPPAAAPSAQGPG